MINAALVATTVFLALAGGIVVGTSFVALLVIFDLIPRLAQLSNAYHLSFVFEAAVISGALYFTVADFFDLGIKLPYVATSTLSGLFNGMFVGMLAAALTEVMNVLPILAKRLRLSAAMVALMMAMVLGKLTGSLVDWLLFQW
ncbi:stage V sporulation protein AB [Paenibacillus montaniterrae]|uniref:Stage V sporulation protein AB n=1 Tax=Paenibacillus montaniterrae TaxID=429341 RepID=A0A919YIW8_9BACL|nr:stage V sporulation protein AB [Paenibacillus montaniterrae]GIP15197.1 stage V sporulation protein AB [Paenibacillus montaniterrae]